MSIDLSFDKASYSYGEPVGMEVVVSNEGVGDILISKGFSTKTYYLEMRVVDPAGRVLVATKKEPSSEFPDARPLGFSEFNGKIIRVGRCEVVSGGWEQVSRTEDLRAYYDLGLPGYYSAQVQLSAMTFKGAPCDVNDYEWKGVVKSETKFFYVHGGTKVDVEPPWWRLAWRTGDPILPNVKVVIWPPEGKTVDIYQKGSIRLNNVPAKEVVKLYSFLKRKHYLLAFFEKRDAVNSLGTVQVGEHYPVVISGRLTSDQFFGGGDKIKVVP